MSAIQGVCATSRRNIGDLRRSDLREVERGRPPAPASAECRIMLCKDVEIVVEQEGLAPLPEAARAHVAACSRCQEFVGDLAAIVSVAKELLAEVAPPARVWFSIQAQLELEGIIKTPVVSAHGERSSWWLGFNELFRSRALATAAVGLLIIAAGVLQLRQTPDVRLETNANVSEPVWQIPFAQTAQVLNKQEIDLRNMQVAKMQLAAGTRCRGFSVLEPARRGCSAASREAFRGQQPAGGCNPQRRQWPHRSEVLEKQGSGRPRQPDFRQDWF